MAVIDQSERPTVLSKEDARSGETSGHMRGVLGVSLTLTVLALAAVLGWFFVFR